MDFKSSIYDHLKEIKQRISRIILVFLIFFTLSLLVVDKIYAIIITPLSKISGKTSKIMFTGLTEVFFSNINIALFTSFILIIPYIFWNIYKFISPGLYKTEKHYAKIIFLLSGFLFYLGLLFVYFFVIPKAWEYFLSFEMTNEIYELKLQAKLTEYISLILSLLIAFAIAFQLPVIILVLILLGVLSVSNLKKFRRLSIVLNFILAAIITPPDVISQIALAIPLVIMYEITILIGKFIEVRRKNA